VDAEGGSAALFDSPLSMDSFALFSFGRALKKKEKFQFRFKLKFEDKNRDMKNFFGNRQVYPIKTFDCVDVVFSVPSLPKEVYIKNFDSIDAKIPKSERKLEISGNKVHFSSKCRVGKKYLITW
jgi:hypothetical protein